MRQLKIWGCSKRRAGSRAVKRRRNALKDWVGIFDARALIAAEEEQLVLHGSATHVESKLLGTVRLRMGINLRKNAGRIEIIRANQRRAARLASRRSQLIEAIWRLQRHIRSRQRCDRRI